MKTRIYNLVSGFVLLTAVALGQSATKAAGPAVSGSADQDKPIAALPYTPSLDVASMDKSADPCVDFYQYACGGWMKNNPIPGDQASWSQVIAAADASGLGLPDRDYYMKDDAKSQEIRQKYLAHIQNMLKLLGDSPDTARNEAQTIMRIETALAKSQLTRVQQRDPHNLFHKMDRKGLQALTPDFNWNTYLKARGVADVNVINVSEPKFYQELDAQLKDDGLDDIRTYLRWHIVSNNASSLSSNFVQEDFDFYSHTLRGVEQQPPRWKRCVRLVDAHLGEALGQEFVARTFSPETKKSTREMTLQIEQAMEDDLKQLTWMGPETKKQALEKLHGVLNKIGYPDKWRDYSSLEIRRDDFLGNVQRGRAFEFRRQLNKIGKPLDRGEWDLTPPTVDADYDPQMNTINFPAGVLQPPLYDPKLDDAPNYGNTGGTIGHE